MVESDLYIESNTACSNLVRDATNVGVMLGHWPRGLSTLCPHYIALSVRCQGLFSSVTMDRLRAYNGSYEKHRVLASPPTTYSRVKSMHVAESSRRMDLFAFRCPHYIALSVRCQGLFSSCRISTIRDGRRVAVLRCPCSLWTLHSIALYRFVVNREFRAADAERIDLKRCQPASLLASRRFSGAEKKFFLLSRD